MTLGETDASEQASRVAVGEAPAPVDMVSVLVGVVLATLGVTEGTNPMALSLADDSCEGGDDGDSVRARFSR